jgi:hypothetical protein
MIHMDQMVGTLSIDSLAGQAEFTHFIDSHWGPLWSIIQSLCSRADHSACSSGPSRAGSQLSAAFAEVHFGSGETSPCPSLLPASSPGSTPPLLPTPPPSKATGPPDRRRAFGRDGFPRGNVVFPRIPRLSSYASEDRGAGGLPGAWRSWLRRLLGRR